VSVGWIVRDFDDVSVEEEPMAYVHAGMSVDLRCSVIVILLKNKRARTPRAVWREGKRAAFVV
jgi:hypothetical protein